MFPSPALSLALALAGLCLSTAHATPPQGPLPPAKSPAAMVAEDRLMATIAALPAARSAVGDVAHQQGLSDAENWLIAQVKALGLTPTLHPLTWNLAAQEASDRALAEQGRQTGAAVRLMAIPPTTPELKARVWNNIVIDLPGRTRPREVLIIGAHFDAVPDSPGADDNATGVAAALETLRLLRDQPMERTVRVIFFNLEEIGLKGAAQYVRDHRDRWQRPEPAEQAPVPDDAELILGMLSFEMLGYYCDQPGCQRSPVPAIPNVFEPPTTGDTIVLATMRRVRPFNERLERLMREGDPDLKTFRFDFAPVAPPDVLRSDHAPFLLAGVNAVMVTDTANFRNPHYHRPTDTIDTLDPVRFARTTRGLVHAVWQIAGPIEPSPGPASNR